MSNDGYPSSRIVPGSTEDVESFLDQYTARRNRDRAAATSPSSSSATPRALPYYHPRRPLIPSLSSSTDTFRTRSDDDCSSIFDLDSHHPSTVSTVSAAAAEQQQQVPAAPPLIYPCDSWPEPCHALFALGEEEEWLAHVSGHLGGMFPRVSRCWFCDDVVFAADDAAADLEQLFRQRMTHIAHHLRGAGAEDLTIRPDFDLVDHLVDVGLADESMRDTARHFHELPPPPGMRFGTPPPPWGRPQPAVVTVSSGWGGGGRHGASRPREKTYRV